MGVVWTGFEILAKHRGKIQNAYILNFFGAGLSLKKFVFLLHNVVPVPPYCCVTLLLCCVEVLLL